MAQPVVGPNLEGIVPVPKAPVIVGGLDSTGAVRTLRVDSGGSISNKTSLTGSAPTAATVGTSSAEAVPVNTSRKGLVLVNTSANWISLAFGAAAVLYSGITLSPNGGSWVMDDYTFSTAQIRAIASGASSNLAVQEMV